MFAVAGNRIRPVHKARSSPKLRVVLPCTPLIGEEKALAAVAANRNKPKIKNQRKLLITRNMPKVNRNKTRFSGSPAFRPSAANYFCFRSYFPTSEEEI